MVSAVPAVGFVGTYPPTQCGLATFTRALLRSMTDHEPGRAVGVVAVVEHEPTASPAPPVVATWVQGDLESCMRAVGALDDYDAVILQHEYGIFGGPDGDEVITLLNELEPPVITVVHTVLMDPTGGQRRVLEQVCRSSQRVVVMTNAARCRLHGAYNVDRGKTVVIPHGAPRSVAPSHGSSERPLVLTWGLLGPGKGLELAIDAMDELRDLVPLPRYVIAGQTHPKVVEASGEIYRESLMARVARAGLGHMVEFDDAYCDPRALSELIAQCDVVLLPYESREQVTSGVLVEATAAVKPVVATAFPHAVELLGPGAGATVRHDDPVAMGQAVRRILIHPRTAAGMRAAAARVAPQLFWSSVGQRFGELVAAVVARRSVSPAVA